MKFFNAVSWGFTEAVATDFLSESSFFIESAFTTLVDVASAVESFVDLVVSLIQYNTTF